MEQQTCESARFEPKQGERLTPSKVTGLLEDKFSSIDFDQAKIDVIPFIKEPRALDIWSPGFFVSIARDKLIFSESAGKKTVS